MRRILYRLLLQLRELVRIKLIEFFKVIIVVQLFFAVSVELITWSFAEENLPLTYIEELEDIKDVYNLDTISDDMEDSVSRQQNLPVIDVGALVYHSGNILMNLIANFLFALPIMIGLIISTLTKIFALDPKMVAYVQSFFVGLVSVAYIIGIVQLFTGIRSGRVIE
jgi:hypothetical protein